MSWRCAPCFFSSAPSCWEPSEFGNESNDNAKGRIIAAADGGAEHRGPHSPVFVFLFGTREPPHRRHPEEAARLSERPSRRVDAARRLWPAFETPPRLRGASSSG